MGSISNVPNGLSYVAAALGGVTSGGDTGSTKSQDFQKILESASPADAVVLSSAALQLQQVDGILGLQSPAEDNVVPAADQLAAITAQSQTAAQATNPYCAAVANSGKLNVLA